MAPSSPGSRSDLDAALLWMLLRKLLFFHCRQHLITVNTPIRAPCKATLLRSKQLGLLWQILSNRRTSKLYAPRTFCWFARLAPRLSTDEELVSNTAQDRIGVPGDIWVHVVGINHMLNDPKSTFDASNDFDMSLIIVLCSIIVRSAACVYDNVLTRTEW